MKENLDENNNIKKRILVNEKNHIIINPKNTENMQQTILKKNSSYFNDNQTILKKIQNFENEKSNNRINQENFSKRIINNENSLINESLKLIDIKLNNQLFQTKIERVRQNLNDDNLFLNKHSNNLTSRYQRYKNDLDYSYLNNTCTNIKENPIEIIKNITKNKNDYISNRVKKLNILNDKLFLKNKDKLNATLGYFEKNLYEKENYEDLSVLYKSKKDIEELGGKIQHTKEKLNKCLKKTEMTINNRKNNIDINNKLNIDLYLKNIEKTNYINNKMLSIIFLNLDINSKNNCNTISDLGNGTKNCYKTEDFENKNIKEFAKYREINLKNDNLNKSDNFTKKDTMNLDQFNFQNNFT